MTRKPIVSSKPNYPPSRTAGLRPVSPPLGEGETSRMYRVRMFAAERRIWEGLSAGQRGELIREALGFAPDGTDLLLTGTPHVKP